MAADFLLVVGHSKNAGVPTLNFPRRWPHPLHGREGEAGRSRSVAERLGVNVMPGAWIIIEPETGPAANERQHNTAHVVMPDGIIIVSSAGFSQVRSTAGTAEFRSGTQLIMIQGGLGCSDCRELHAMVEHNLSTGPCLCLESATCAKTTITNPGCCGVREGEGEMKRHCCFFPLTWQR